MSPPHDHPHERVGKEEATVSHAPLLYVDCFSGISGDMLLGALLDAGLPRSALDAGLAELAIDGYRLEVQSKSAFGVAGTKVDVLVDETAQPERRLADILELLARSQLPQWVRANAEAVFRRLAEAEAKIHASTVEAVHFHEVGAVDSIVDVVGGLIGIHALGITTVYASSLPLPGGTVRARHGLLPAPAPATLEILAQVGAPTRPAPVLGELVTPTGAAILAQLATFEQPPMRVRRVGYGYGTKALPWPNVVRVWLGEPWSPGPPRFASLSAQPTHIIPPDPASTDPHVGVERAEEPAGRPHAHAPAGGEGPGQHPDSPELERGAAGERPAGDEALAREDGPASRGGLPAETVEAALRRDEVVVVEANLDDATPELLGFAMERLFEAGALDVYFAPIQMKKNRPGTLLGVIGRPAQASALAEVVLRETTTLGVRLRRSERLIAERRAETVLTPFGPVRVKLKLLGRRTVAAPEYEDCARLAREQQVPLADVYRAAQLAAEGIGQ